MIDLKVKDLGLLDYEQVWGSMVSAISNRTQDEPDEVWFVQHPAVYTLGYAGSELNILEQNNIPLVLSDRGGEITAHMPGQLIAYPILSLKEKRLTPKKLVYILEETVIHLLKQYGILGERCSKKPGIWVDGSKICSIGLRFSSKVSKHGIAINLTNDLSLFKAINPCGLKNCPIVRACDLTNAKITIEEASQKLGAFFSTILGYQIRWIDIL